MMDYIRFVEQMHNGKRVVAVVSKSSGAELGGIAYHPQWRQYVFIPNGETIWSEDCLAAVRQQVLAMTGRA